MRSQPAAFSAERVFEKSAVAESAPNLDGRVQRSFKELWPSALVLSKNSS